MFTEPLYLFDTFKYDHSATITNLGTDEIGHFIILDSTIFHPQGGGQPSDQGTIAGKDVTAVKSGSEIKHYVADLNDLAIGQTVSLNISENKRREFATLHTAGHLLAGIAEKFYPVKAKSGHHFPAQARVDVLINGEVPEDRQLMKKKLEDEINAAVTAGNEVNTNNENLADRQVEIKDICKNGCSGTHLSNLNQIGTFAIRKINTKKLPEGPGLSIGYDASPR